MTIRYDMIEIKADVSPEGWIRDKPVITRSGVFVYRQPNGNIVREFRPEDEVFHEDSLNSLSGIPITIKHKGLINKNNVSGIVGTVIAPGERQDSNVVANVVIHDVNKLGKARDLSLGYECVTETAPPGAGYDVIQRKIRYNHLAVVEKGRAGNARLRLDADDAASFELENDTMDPKLVTIRLDEIDYQASPEVAKALSKSDQAIADLKKRFDALEAERDSLKSKIDEHANEIVKVRDTVKSEMGARSRLEAVASQMELKFDESDSNVEVMKKVINKIRPSIRLDGKSDDYIQTAFDIAVEMDGDKNKKLFKQIDKTQKRADKSDDTDNVASADNARVKMIEKMRSQHLPKSAA